MLNKIGKVYIAFCRIPQVVRFIWFILGIQMILSVGIYHIIHSKGKELVIDNLEVAKVISAEACGEGAKGMQAVANTIHNRSVNWHKTLNEVIMQKNQYYGYTASNKEELYRQCEDKANELAVNIDNLEDITGGALYFLQDGERKGSWIGEKTVTIGNHTFYKEK